MNPQCSVLQLKCLIQQADGTPSRLQGLIYAGRELSYHLQLQSLGISKDACISMVASLRGGNNKSYTSRLKSLKEATHEGLSTTQHPVQTPHPVYIVNKSEEVPTLEIKQPEVIQNLLLHKEETLICIFNGLWPKKKDLL